MAAMSACAKSRWPRKRPGANPAPTRWVRPDGSGQPDQSVVIGVAAVDDACLVGLLVVEQEEVVADELHLVERVVDRHRSGFVFLGADDVAGFVLGGQPV